MVLNNYFFLTPSTIRQIPATSEQAMRPVTKIRDSHSGLGE